ncbi:uncharacterized protein LOC113463306 [Phoenix dactylifera]|uniref:Uncharacterized protein LOC113463306 n=1 Tax=Phoenix dactylifera TaxID=42345 RepID=A0A8B9AGC3_PHODC|nr:uncharacterized protein LOC113463306 [Phoenix dactylifera]
MGAGRVSADGMAERKLPREMSSSRKRRGGGRGGGTTAVRRGSVLGEAARSGEAAGGGVARRRCGGAVCSVKWKAEWLEAALQAELGADGEGSGGDRDEDT